MCDSSRSPKQGSSTPGGGGGGGEMVARHDALFNLKFAGEVLPSLECIGHTPLPHYMERFDEYSYREVYQTLYSQSLGAVAAPLAGLHFDQSLLDTIAVEGVESACVTPHTKADAFRSVHVDNIEDHKDAVLRARCTAGGLWR